MKLGTRTWSGIAAAVVVIGLGALAVAQPPRGPGGGPPSDFGGGPPGPPPFDPLREALDRDHDHRLDAEEIKNAATALLSLDGNGDGVIDEEEFRPPHPPGDHGPPGEGPPGGFGPPRGEGRGEGPPRGGPPGERGPGGPGRGERGPGGPGQGERGPGGPPPGGAPEGGPGGGRGPGMGPPSPERFVERAMSFDTDKDGKLDRNELMKFAEEMGRQRGGPGVGGPPGGGPPGGPEGRGGRRGPEGAGGPSGGREGRTERPRRPE